MIKLKNKICQGTLEIIFLEIEKAEAEKNNIGTSGWSQCLTGNEGQGTVVTRGWHWVIIFGSLRFLAALTLRDVHHCLDNL